MSLQGDFAEHAALIENVGGRAVAVRRSSDLEGCLGVVLPGGESTTIGKLLDRAGLIDPLRRWVHERRPTLATCAGAILLSDSITIGGRESDQVRIGGLPLRAHRNAYGRQVFSFEARIPWREGGRPFAGPQGDRDGDAAAVAVIPHGGPAPAAVEPQDGQEPPRPPRSGQPGNSPIAPIPPIDTPAPSTIRAVFIRAPILELLVRSADPRASHTPTSDTTDTTDTTDTATRLPGQAHLPTGSRSAEVPVVCASYNGDPVVVDFGDVTVCTFHPELVGEAILHERLVRRAIARGRAADQ